MDHDLIPILSELGLSVNESKVYLSLLYLGSSSVGSISHHETTKGVHRTNIYEALERLKKKNLVCLVPHPNKSVYEATNPELLVQMLESKKAQLETVMPRLKLAKQLSKKSSAHMFEGVTAFSEALFNWLKYNDSIVAFGIPAIVPEIVKSFIGTFHSIRTSKKIWMYHLYNENAQERIKYLNTLPYTEAKYLPEEYNSPVTTLVVGHEIIIVNWEKPVTFIKIEDEHLARHYKKYFELIYNSPAAKKIT